jgi:hypothetical protein
MQPVQDCSTARSPSGLLLRSVRWAVMLLRRGHALAIVSWLGLLLAVALFAVWMLYHYQPPAQPAWVGMTIRTFGFAAWMLVLREWLVICVRFRNPPHDTYTQDEE